MDNPASLSARAKNYELPAESATDGQPGASRSITLFLQPALTPGRHLCFLYLGPESELLPLRLRFSLLKNALVRMFESPIRICLPLLNHSRFNISLSLRYR